jgi:hypothetical protein
MIKEVTYEDESPKELHFPAPISLNNVDDSKGYWISPDGKIYDVDTNGGHAEFAEKFIFKIKDMEEWSKLVDAGVLKYRDIRLDTLELGWMRIRFHTSKFYPKLAKGHKKILEVQSAKINDKQKKIISILIKSKNSIAVSTEEFNKHKAQYN